MSKTQTAINMVRDGTPVAEAARKAGISTPTLYVALKRLRDQENAGKERCPCCGQVVREGFSVDRSVLKVAPNEQE